MNNKNKILELSRSTAHFIDQFTEHTGRLTAWIILFMVLLVSYDVTMRYVFNQGSVALQEMEWHLFALVFLIGAAYTLKHDDHVRLDLFYQSRFNNDYSRAWINLIGGLVFLIPFCILIIYSSWFFVLQSWFFNEGSPDPGGLPYRWLLKAAIPLGFLFLLIQAIAECLRNLAFILEQK